MNFEDINTIYEKYKYCSFTYELTYDDIVNNEKVDFWSIEKTGDTSYDLNYDNIFLTKNIYIWGDNQGDTISVKLEGDRIPKSLGKGQSILFNLIADTQYKKPLEFNRLQSIVEPFVYFPEQTIKVYIEGGTHFIGMGTLHYDNDDNWVIEDTVEFPDVKHDEHGQYILFNLPSISEGNEIAIIYGHYGTMFHDNFALGKIIYPPSLPVVSVNPLYKGNTQTVEVLLDNTLVSTDYYSVSYEGKELKNNKINVPLDKDNITLKITLNHPEYVHTTLDYNVPLEYYKAYNIRDIKNALRDGFNYITTEAGITIDEELTLADTTLIINHELNINDSVTLSNSTLITNATVTGGRLNLQDTKLNNATIESCLLEIHDTEITDNSSLVNCEIHVYGESIIKDSILSESLLISDSDNLTIENNKVYCSSNTSSTKTHFPNSLYLTGNMDCNGNTFIGDNEYSTAIFSTALLKTIPSNDIDKFIQNNTFQLTTQIGNRTYTGLFYTLIDDDTLHYKEVE